MSWVKRSQSDKQSAANPRPTAEQIALDGTVIPSDDLGFESLEQPTDGLADGWSADEAVRAELGSTRRTDDIPNEEFAAYQNCMEETLNSPDEVWSLVAEQTGSENPELDSVKLFHFIKQYEEAGFWYIMVAKELPEEEQLEIVEAFPTRDSELAERYRQGVQELGGTGVTESASRVLH